MRIPKQPVITSTTPIIPTSTMKPISRTIIRKSPIRGGFSSHAMFFMFLIVIAFLVYLYSVHIADIRAGYSPPPVGGIDPATYLIPRPSGSAMSAAPTIGGLSTRLDVLSDPYLPPMKVDGYLFDSRSSDIRGMPPLVAPVQSMGSVAPMVSPLVNMETRGIQNQYSQVGILTKAGSGSGGFSRKRAGDGDGEDSGAVESRLILPLMGRRHMTGRDKWQYYAISNTGNLNTKLPIQYNGRSCTSEYGCDPLSSGDMVYVEGYGHAFKATIYENSLFSYLPVL